MFAKSSHTPKSWLAFELNVLRRLKFDSVLLPFTNQPHLGTYLKRWNARVLANDATFAGWTKAVASIQNNAETLSEEDVKTVLEDAYVPGYRLQNSALRDWFNETDAWWFDNVRRNVERLDSPFARAMALTVGMSVGDYVLSFTDETRELRQPLSKVFRRLWSQSPAPVNNGQNNTCQNKTANAFIRDNLTDLMFLRLPAAHNQTQRNRLGAEAWREEWLRLGAGFWSDFEAAQSGRLGTLIETKSQYLRLVEETLQTAKKIPVWAIAHVEDGFVSTSDVVEAVSRFRSVNTIYTKDFSELTGAKAVIVTA